ncbi:hypothetical protein C882_3292 [Caenispirillum salinarum AK4]|uniref:Transmembrane protein n=1 Tax=Caenispirillum salinarum AK4 TaxID=1238182 RepID=K9HPN3_9PROT|nr:TIGR02186 family protein [Caenispirillum salinarum]EKV32228.1 hypothetical protein C882_3292 [Caenispirillum salinarum AK4]
MTQGTDRHRPTEPMPRRFAAFRRLSPLRAAATAACVALSLWLGAMAAKAVEQPLVADLSKHLVAITTGFAGTDVLLFGATDAPGDVVLVVRGPEQEVVVRRKDKLAGVIWANVESVTFEGVPSFYKIAASRPLLDFLPPELRERHRIGFRHLDFRAPGTEGMAPAAREAFREALVRLKVDTGLYQEREGGVRTLANRLFRSELYFPSNVPTGTYMVEVYLVRDGEVVSAEITPLVISKVGIGAEIFHFAYTQSVLYGLAAILVAVAAGWLAGLVFRKT